MVTGAIRKHTRRRRPANRAMRPDRPARTPATPRSGRAGRLPVRYSVATMPRPFSALPASADLPSLEHEVLRRWRDGKIFERSVDQTAGGPEWVFYEGPPTANGMPGVHHIEARVLKDAFPRFKTMQGFHVPRRAGWDCHGLPVEVAVEKELGLTSKRDIEAYGITAFNARCRESVLRHVDAFAEFTQRMGYWVDLSRAYRTMDPGYSRIELPKVPVDPLKFRDTKKYTDRMKEARDKNRPVLLS